MSRRWHRWVLGHTQYRQWVPVPVLGPAASGYLVRCECGRDWALWASFGRGY